MKTISKGHKYLIEYEGDKTKTVTITFEAGNKGGISIINLTRVLLAVLRDTNENYQRQQIEHTIKAGQHMTKAAEELQQVKYYEEHKVYMSKNQTIKGNE